MLTNSVVSSEHSEKLLNPNVLTNRLVAAYTTGNVPVWGILVRREQGEAHGSILIQSSW